MAKKKRKSKFTNVQRERFGTDIEALGLSSKDVDKELRFNPGDQNAKQRIELLSRYGLVKVRVHADGDKLWRVALTDTGREIASEHERKVARQRQSMTEAELEERNDRHTEKFARTMLNDPQMHDKGGIEGVELPPDAVLITTPTLRAFQHKAVEKDYSRVLTDEVLDSLVPNAKHRVRQAWKHVSYEGYRNIRLQIEIHTKNPIQQDGLETRNAICDISNRDWDMLMVPHMNKTRRSSIVPENDNVLYIAAPEWAAVRSYPVVHQLHSYYHGHASAYVRSGWHGPFQVPQKFGQWEHTQAHTLRGDDALAFLHHPRTPMNSIFLEQLQDAHPVIIDPDWVEIQEDWNLNEAWAYAERVVLPFDPLYLDFEGPGGTLPQVNVYENVKMTLAGCLFYTDWKTGRLVIAPVGGRQWLDLALETGALAGGFPYEQCGEVIFGGRCEEGRALQVKIADAEEPTTITGAYVVPANMETLLTEAVAIDLPSYQEQAEGQDEIPEVIEDPWRVPGYIFLPLTPDEALTQNPNSFERVGTEIGLPEWEYGAWMGVWSRVVVKLAAKSLSILSLLDNENVEIREAELPRQQRRQIERERQKGRERGIASEIVVIRKTRYVNGKPLDNGHEIEYSHQWRVRRHEQHHGPHTRTYQAKPWLAKPCGRCGSCRRFIIDSYIKGPPDKPLKDNKTYKFQDPEE